MRRGLGYSSQPEHRPRASRSAAPARKRDGEDTLSVGELTRRIKHLLEGSVGPVAVEGEVSGLKASPSGHVYFSLKDKEALIDAVIWRSAVARIKNPPRDGDKVVARGRLAVYEPRGRYQLVVTSFAGGGDKGDLWKKFEELKERLAAEGLFAPERKKPLPAAPKTLGIVTSPGGAALRDMLKILKRRAPGLGIVVSPCLVQGAAAPADIVGALERLERWGGADLVVVGRGGGSLEDLWPFNDEAVARAIVRMSAPVVSAVGHETDFTIADFVADARAATPSEAAEMAVPDRAEQGGRLARAAVALARALSGVVRERRERLAGLAERPVFRRPGDMQMMRWQRLDDALGWLRRGMERRVSSARNRLGLTEARLAGLSPRNVLARGYALVLDSDGVVVTDAASVCPGGRVAALLHRGRLDLTVLEAHPAADETAEE